MSLKNVTVKENNTAEMQLLIEREAFDRQCDVVYRRKVKDMKIPGFRPGKAPRGVVEKMYGKGIFFEDAINDLLPAAFEAALTESGLDIVGRPEFDIENIDDEGVTMKVTVTTRPVMTMADYKGIAVDRVTEPVTEEMVDAEIARVQKRNARTIDVADRAAQNGDIVNIDYAGSVDGVAFDGGTAEKQNLTLGSGQFIPGFEDQIIGHNIGDKFDVNVTFPTEYHAEDLAGKAAVFAVTLHGIQVEQLPILDDEFAKDVSEFETLAEYRADIKAKLEERHAKDADNGVEGAIIDALLAKLEGDIPAVMFEDETDHLLRDYEQRMQMQGLSLDIYFKYTGMTMEQLREQMKPQAERQVRTRLALETIAKNEAFEITEEMLADEYARLAEEYKLEVDKIKAYIPAEDLKKDLAVQQAVAFVKANAVITEKVAEHTADCDCGCHDHE